MSADHLPLIDPEAYFDSPSIPDGDGVGFVDANGIVYDRQKRPIGRDRGHPANRDDIAAIESALAKARGMIADPMAPEDARRYEQARTRAGDVLTLSLKRAIVSLFEVGDFTVAMDDRGDAWSLEHSGWVKLARTNLPPLPQD